MDSKDRVYDMLTTAIRNSPADETEILLSDYRLISIRFANNTVHQNVDETGARVSVRAILGRKHARYEMNTFTPDALRNAVQNAIELARIMPEDREALPLPGQVNYPEVKSFDPELANLDPGACVDKVKQAIALAKAAGVEAAGTLNVSIGPAFMWGMVPPSAVANSRGVFGYHRSTDIDFSITCKKGDGSGYASRGSHWLKDVSVEDLTRTAIEKGMSSQSPCSLAPGRYPCLLEPLAAAELVGWVAGAFNALKYSEGLTFVTGALGRKIGGENVTLIDDPYHPLQQGRPFDDEGVPKKKVTLLEQGVVKELLHDRRTAKKFETESNGRSYEMPNAWGPIPSNVILNGGTAEPQDIVKGLDRGVLITRFWYTNYVDPRKGILTGMTRDGVFWIENGKIQHPVKNFRFNCDLGEFLKSIRALSKPVLVDSSTLVPAMIVDNFNLESSTEF